MANERVVYRWLKPNRFYQKYKVPAFLQPRLTWRYVFCSAAAAYVAYCFIFSMPLFAHNLPAYTGPHPVGAIDIETPLIKPRVINDATFKGTDEYAFKVETVLFTLYYPATKQKATKPRHYWIPKPIAATAEGYAKFAHINNFFTNKILAGTMGMLVGSVRIPAKVNVPLADETVLSPSAAPYQEPADSAETLVEPDVNGFPVIVFTHGMASSRTDYTQYCGELASRGYVVAAIEHRDGSSPGTMVTKQSEEDRKLVHFSIDDITSTSPMDMSDFKEAQLNYRQAEIEETVKVLQSINAGQGSSIYDTNTRREGTDLLRWSGRLNTTSMIIAGHSYGATGALQALKNGPTPALPFHGAIALDPGKASGPLNSNISIPLLIIHSNSWSSSRSIFYGRPHFNVVRDIVETNNKRGNPSWFMTSLGTSHPSVTDAPLIEPMLLSWTTGSKINVHEAVRQYVHVTEDFLQFIAIGEKRGLMAEKAEFPDYDEKFGFGRKYKGQAEDGWKRFWQVHVAPEK